MTKNQMTYEEACKIVEAQGIANGAHSAAGSVEQYGDRFILRINPQLGRTITSKGVGRNFLKFPKVEASRKCYCPSDCNCRYVGDPIFGHRGRMASCGCQCQSDKNKAR